VWNALSPAAAALWGNICWPALTAQGHKTWVLMRSPGNIERLKEQVGQLGGNPEYIHAVEGDISQEGGLASAKQTKNASLRPLYFSISRRNFPGG
jgi:hypothetical protein